jgi:hypothetical protein
VITPTGWRGKSNSPQTEGKNLRTVPLHGATTRKTRFLKTKECKVKRPKTKAGKASITKVFTLSASSTWPI